MGVISKLLFVPGLDGAAPVLFAGAMGNPAQPNAYRGLFRSADAGVNWEQVLLPNDSAGVTDLLYDPDTEAIYAAAWQRTRNSTASEVWGPHCRIWKSVDNGTNWQAIPNPWGQGERGRIGFTHSSQGVYALSLIHNSEPTSLLRSS